MQSMQRFWMQPACRKQVVDVSAIYTKYFQLVATPIEKFLKLTLRPKAGFSTDSFVRLLFSTQASQARALQAVMRAGRTPDRTRFRQDNPAQSSSTKLKTTAWQKNLIHKESCRCLLLPYALP